MDDLGMQGSATYYSAGASRQNLAWSYDSPTPRFAAIKGSLAFYPSKVGEGHTMAVSTENLTAKIKINYNI
jgi:uncharacterized protein (DUF427 family)